jgi:hypothetical protein
MEALEVWENKGERLKIYCDPEPQDHRDFDNLGIMLCAHGRYTLGDEQFNDRESLDQRLEELDPVVKLPLWLLDHSGLAMQTGSFISDAQQWDSGQVGWIVATKKDILDKIYPEQRPRPSRSSMIKNAERILGNEVADYDNYLQGNVYGYELFEVTKCTTAGFEDEEHEKEVDSCWGFYPMKGEDASDVIKGAIGIPTKGWVQQ